MRAPAPLWHLRCYDVSYVAKELAKHHPPAEAVRRLLAYADWLRLQEAPTASSQPQPSR